MGVCVVARRSTRVTIEGLDDVRRRLNDPALIDKPMVGLLTEATSLATRVAIDKVDGGLGKAARSIQGKVERMQGRVYSMMPAAKARSIDQGRRPGASLGALLPGLIRWREAVGHPETGIVIALEVRRRGTKGKFFKQEAQDSVRNKLPDFIKTLEAKLESKWKSGA